MAQSLTTILGRYVVEPVLETHLRQVMRLAWKTTSHLYPAFFFQEIAKREPENFRVVLDGREGPVVAFIVAARQPGRQQDFLLLAVEPALVGFGLRRALIRDVEDSLRSQGVARFAIEAPVAHDELLDFYRSEGFEIVTVESADVNGIEDRVLLAKDLPAAQA